MRLIILTIGLTALTFLSACAIPLEPQEMYANQNAYDSLSHRLDRKITLGKVSSKEGLGGATPVTAPNYELALQSSLRQAGWYSPSDSAKYTLNASLLELKQPFMGFNMTVNSTAQYDLINTTTGKTAYSEQINIPCTKGIADAFDGAVRLRKATGCAVSENITHLLKVLSSKKL